MSSELGGVVWRVGGVWGLVEGPPGSVLFTGLSGMATNSWAKNRLKAGLESTSRSLPGVILELLLNPWAASSAVKGSRGNVVNGGGCS